MCTFQFWESSRTILKTVTVTKFYLFLRFSFLFLVFTAPFTAGACVAFACPVAFRCSNSLFRDGNAQLQVTQWMGTSFCNEGKTTMLHICMEYEISIIHQFVVCSFF